MPRYCARVIEQIQASDFAKIDFLVYRRRAAVAMPPAGGGLLGGIRKRLFNPNLRKRALYDSYLQLDQRKKPRDHPRDEVDASSRLAGIDSITVETTGERFVDRFPAEAVERVRERNLDVLIRFGFNILKGDILSAARYGVWSYHHGDNEFYRGGPPHFWEIYERNPLSGVILQVLTEELDAGLVLCKSLFTTENTISVSQNNFVPYWGANDLMIRKLNQLHRFGWDRVKEDAVPPVPYKGKRRLYRTPTNLEMARWLGPILLKKAVQRPFRKDSVQHWRIATRLNATPLFGHASNGNLEGFRWIDSPKGHFWADPFLLEHGGRRWMFFEDYIYEQRRGLIACAEIAADGSPSSPVPCLDEPAHHYSYPYIFRAGEECFMIPETLDAGSVDLYRCEQFPSKWSRQATLLHGRFVDPSIWRHHGLWWLMVTSADPDSRASNLFLFYSEKPTGPWNFHPANPISTDIRNNRGAGRIMHADGRWIRPSQSGCPTYGYSFSFNEILRLSPAEYEERHLREFKPESLGVEAMHTYNWIPGVEVIDGAQDRPVRNV